MLGTIRHQDHGELVVVAKLLTGYDKVSEKVADIDSYIKVNDLYDADFVAFVVSWQTSHGCTPDGIIGPETWRAITKAGRLAARRRTAQAAIHWRYSFFSMAISPVMLFTARVLRRRWRLFRMLGIWTRTASAALKRGLRSL